ncbi:MAG TPA: hypothetical protein VJW76_04525, partial [Verrucomicrobiae bacterium]|nr:hypothetical protein [Verrucomicrobiae bacterium]
AGGSFQINDEAVLDLQEGGSCTVAGGTFSLGTNAVLQLVDGSPPGERLLLADAAILQGTGRIEVYNQNILDLGSRISVPYAVWMMHPNAQLVTAGSHFEMRAGDRLQGMVAAPVVVPAGVEYTQGDGTSWSNLVSVSNGGKLNLNGALTHTFTGGLLNEGHVVVRSVGSGNETHLRGVGVTNRGIFEVQHTLGASAKRFFLPVRNEAGGDFQINDNTLLHLEAGASLTVAGGTFFLGSDAVLRLMDGSNPPETLALADAAILQGSGRIEVHSQNILDVGSRTSLPYAVWMMHATAQLVTAGSHFEVRTGDRLQGIVGAPMVVPNGVEYTQTDNSTWSNRMSVANGGTLNLNGALTHTFNAGLINEGHVVVRSVSFGNETHLRGVGITNLGLFEVQHTAGSGPKRFFGPVRNDAGGTFQINDGTLVHLEAGADLALAGGTFDLATNAVLRFVDGAPPAERLTLGAGVVLQGAGTIHFQNNNGLVLEANANLGEWKLVFDGTSTINGTFALANTVGGAITFNHSMAVPGSMTIAGTLTVGNPGLTVIINGALTLAASGVINNPGTLNAGAFVNNGGTINGNAPILIGGMALGAVRIGQIDILDGEVTQHRKSARTTSAQGVRLAWSSGAGERFLVEGSQDLRTWTPISSTIDELSPGHYRATVPGTNDKILFLRLYRVVPSIGGGPLREIRFGSDGRIQIP